MQRSLAAVLSVVERTIATHGMIPPGVRVMVAVSGGSDSVGLLAILSHLSRRLETELICAHVNHRLRGHDADADEACAARVAARLRVRFVRAEIELEHGGNLEERGREARYRALHDMANEMKCDRIATGHTEDDQAETVLLRLARGAGPSGIAGIRPCRPDGVIRPLIECSRDSLRGIVDTLGLEWRYDQSNDDLRFQRNAVRRRVLPALRELNPKATRAIARAAGLFQAQEQLTEAWVDQTLGAAMDGNALDVGCLASIAAPLRGFLVRGWLLCQGVGPRRLTTRHVRAVLSLGEGPGAGGVIALPGNRIVRRRRGRLVVEEGPAVLVQPWESRTLEVGESVRVPGWQLSVGPPENSTRLELSRDLLAAACDAEGVSGAFTVRCPRRGERVRPLGLGGSRKLSDVFTDRKVPADERWCHPLVEVAGQVIWVPGVVRTDFLVIGSGTRRILRLSATRD